jgi:hypothetical protein
MAAVSPSVECCAKLKCQLCLRFFDAGLGATLQLELCVARVGKHD